MRNSLIVSSAIALSLILGGPALAAGQTKEEMMKKDTMEKSDSMMKKDDTMEKSDAMMKKDDAMAKGTMKKDEMKKSQ